MALRLREDLPVRLPEYRAWRKQFSQTIVDKTAASISALVNDCSMWETLPKS